MTLQVDLPDGELIECTRLAGAIALARLTKQGLTGIACVVGKVMKIQLTPKAVVGQVGSIKVDGEADHVSVLPQQSYTPVDQSGVDLRLIQSGSPSGLFIVDDLSNAVDLFAEAGVDQGAISLPYKLTDEDRALLVRLLPHLPQLQAPVTLEAREAFLDAYRAHPDRAGWEPELLSVFNPDAERGRLEELSLKCQQELREDFIQQRFVAFTADHSRARQLFAGTFIPRQLALEYLKQWHDMVPAQHQPSDAVSALVAVSTNIQETGSMSEDEVTEVDAHASGEMERPDSTDSKAVYEYHEALKDRGHRAPTQQTMKYFQISGSLVRRKIRQYKRKRLQLASPFPGSGQ